MWITTSLGFFSVVEKSDDEYQTTLTVQAHLKEDLESLREQVLPTIGPITDADGPDYQFEAKCSRTELATALSEITLGIDYRRLEETVKTFQGEQRSNLYHHVADEFRKLQSPAFSGSHDPSTKKSKLSYGGVVMDRQRGVLLRKPTNEFDGYVWTFAKGKHRQGITPEETALHEVRMKMGYDAKILAKIPGRFEGGYSITEYFLMCPVGESFPFDSARTEATRWVPLDEVAETIAVTKNPVGVRRDQCVLNAVKELMNAQATRLSWDTVDMPERRTQIPFRMRFSRNEVSRLKRGHIPGEMEDHWFVFFEDDWVNFHRSWTGYCIFRLRLEPDGECYRVAEAWASRDERQYQHGDAGEEETTLLAVFHYAFRIGSDPWR
ncbi:MAG: NUDIX domain-containing protein [Planctomycetaceae bacterium]|nr:NUDIX domain-containing protein [Planctomycetaceae bacterium]